MRFRRNSKQEFLEFDFDFRRNSNFDFRTKFRNFGRALFCNLTSIFTEIRPKTGRITWFFLASRGSPENFCSLRSQKFFFNFSSKSVWSNWSLSKFEILTKLYFVFSCQFRSKFRDFLRLFSIFCSLRSQKICEN